VSSPESFGGRGSNLWSVGMLEQAGQGSKSVTDRKRFQFEPSPEPAEVPHSPRFNFTCRIASYSFSSSSCSDVA
jgi:hypothetical protein